MSHKAKLEINVSSPYTPKWTFTCELGPSCVWWNIDHDECNAVTWLENDDALPECLDKDFTAWSGPVNIQWESEPNGEDGYYSFNPIRNETCPSCGDGCLACFEAGRSHSRAELRETNQSWKETLDMVDSLKSKLDDIRNLCFDTMSVPRLDNESNMVRAVFCQDQLLAILDREQKDAQ